jgi:putative flavoprotein involved in K+ transport
LTVVERIDVLVVGAGSAGLAASYHLTQTRVDHLVVDRSQVGQGWRDRWESFCLVTPNWTVQLPGFDYDGNDPDGFLLRDEVVDHLERYAASFSAPLRLGVEVTALRRNGAGYVADTSDGSIEARSVIVATGAFQLPRIPPISQQLPSGVHQLHSSQYRDPESLPDGAVLVVGSGQSGSQIAEELHESRRPHAQQQQPRRSARRRLRRSSTSTCLSHQAAPHRIDARRESVRRVVRRHVR